MSSEPSLSAAFREIFRDMMHGIHTTLPGKIVTFNAATQRATVELATAYATAEGEELAHPILIEVPVMFPRFGGYAITMPVSAGDSVAVHFSERSMERWLKEGQTGKRPVTNRMFDLSDGFATAGLWPLTNSLPEADFDSLRIRSEDGLAEVQLETGVATTVRHGTASVVLLANGNVVITTGLAVWTMTPAGKFTMTNGTSDALTLIHQMLTALIVPGTVGDSNYPTWLSELGTYL